MATKKNRTAAAFLGFLGSLIYLYVTFSAVAAGQTGSWVAGAGSLWIPVLGGLATISSIVLFVLALVGIAGKYTDPIEDMTRKAAIVGGLSLFALTGPSGLLGAGGPFLWSVVGFILAFLGTEWDRWM